jgi:hypothetical protein
VNHKHSNTTMTIQSDTDKRKKKACCPPSEPEPSGCCELICFERPHYFCGHLLTDTDLALEQRYVVEKSKLYHRTLHGHGVVCGLRLTCDHSCSGGIMVGEGYAIDDCGNDLVVCEQVPFDLIGTLRKKGCLIETPTPDPCKPKEEQPECTVRQCFYITICYQEEEADFTTPFAAGCRPKITECEHTRIREGFRFDVVSELPKQVDWSVDLERRLEHCRRLFKEGPFASALSAGKPTLQAAVGGSADPLRHKELWELFCRLSGLLLLYLKKCPDKYNCTIEDDIREIPFPRDPSPTYPQSRRADRDESPEPTGHYEQEQQHAETQGRYTATADTSSDYGKQVKAAFCRLLGLANQHVQACLKGEMLLPCPEPCQVSCVVLGTVEVEHGKVVQVCNTPRSFVSALGSLYKGLIGSVLSTRPIEKNRTGQYSADVVTHADEQACCPEVLFNCQQFVDYLANPHAVYDTSFAFLRLIAALDRSFKYGFDFTRTDPVPPSFFEGWSVDVALKLAAEKKVPMTVVPQPPEPTIPEPQEVLQSYVLRPAQPLIAFQSGGQIVSVQPDLRRSVPLDPDERKALETGIKSAQESAAAIQKELAEKEHEIQDVKAQLDEVAKKAEATTTTVNTGLDEVKTRVQAADIQAAEVKRQIETVSTTSAAERAVMEAKLTEVSAAANANLLKAQSDFETRLKVVTEAYDKQIAELRGLLTTRSRRPRKPAGGTPTPPANPAPGNQ